MKALGVIHCHPLLLDIDTQLVELMRGVRQEDWHRPTVFPEWQVKDIFSHLLDTSLRKLSMQRDGYFDPSRSVQIGTNEELTRYVTHLADEWAAASRRVSPKLLLEWFDRIKDELYNFMASMDPYGVAMFPVSWAGESESYVWFDNAREYTEHWVHQQQIRKALKAPLQYDGKYLQPLNNLLLRALPFACSHIERPEGFSFNIEITGEACDQFCLLRERKKWSLYQGASPAPQSKVRVMDQILWRLLTKNIERSEEYLEITGDREIALQLLRTTSMLV